MATATTPATQSGSSRRSQRGRVTSVRGDQQQPLQRAVEIGGVGGGASFSVRTLREAAGLSQRALAKRAGMNRNTLTRLEQMGSIPRTHEYAPRILRAAQAHGGASRITSRTGVNRATRQQATATTTTGATRSRVRNRTSRRRASRNRARTWGGVIAGNAGNISLTTLQKALQTITMELNRQVMSGRTAKMISLPVEPVRTIVQANLATVGLGNVLLQSNFLQGFRGNWPSAAAFAK